MLEHHIQKTIVYTLSLAPSMRFSDLKPDSIENKLFDYHLKKVIAAGLVKKTEAGDYALTPLGRRVGKDALKQNDLLIDRAYSVFFLAVRRADGAWLMCRRKTHPLLHKVGFMYARPELHSPALEVASEQLKQKAGLSGTFTVRGSGYLRMYENDSLESFTHFTLLECLDAQGDITQLDELSEYFWQADILDENEDLLPTIPLLVNQLAQPGLFFLEHTHKF